MNIKVQCACGTQFSFDVETADGSMPINVSCPGCGQDATEAANAVIAETLSKNSIPASESTSAPRIKLHLHKPAAREENPAEPTSENDVSLKCPRHPRNLAIERCVVCQKPICPECMQSFGYLCSVNCRYRAEQENIKVPVFKSQRSVVEKAENRKTFIIAVGVAGFVLALVAAWFWFAAIGSKPRLFYSLKTPADQVSSHAKFLDSNQILRLQGNQLSLHDIGKKKDVWSTTLEDSTPETGAQDGLGQNLFQYFEDSTSFPEPIFHGDQLWLSLLHQVICVDLKTGEVKHVVPFSGRLTAFTLGNSVAWIVSDKSAATKSVIRIDLESGEFSSQEIAMAPRERVAASGDLPLNVAPTASLLLEQELDGQKRNQSSIYKSSSEFFPAGQNLVQMQVRLIEPILTSVQTIKPAGPSQLNADTRASTSARALLEEINNDMKRARTGGYKMVDESRYSVTLKRTFEADAADWMGEVKGVPIFFSLETVDLLVAGKTLLVFDKQNRKIAESQLTFPVDERFTRHRAPGHVPGIDRTNTLYFFDQGVLSAFNLPDGSVKWRLPSVGIQKIQFDQRGMLYVSSTTATPEDIQYSEQIKIMDQIKPLLLKVDPATGTTLWKTEAGGECILTGKYVYLTGDSNFEFSTIGAIRDAFGIAAGGGDQLRIIRMDPSTGKVLWSFVKSGAPSSIDFFRNRILLNYPDQIQLMKYISF